MNTHPPEPMLVHRLPPAPHFVGREQEISKLISLWKDQVGGVAGLIGLGGAGKTAVAACFLDQLQQQALEPRPHGLFVWSFYQEPDPGLFLESAYRYFLPDSTAIPAKGVSLLH